MNKIKPTLFLTNDEVAEAQKFGYFGDSNRINYRYGVSNHTPTIFWVGNYGLTHQPNMNNLLFTEYFHITKEAVKWSEIREEHRPKEWYEKEGAFPCLCWVWDNDLKRAPRIISSVNVKREKKFTTDTGYDWANATPITKEDLCKS